MTAELKPCPHCGESPHHWAEENNLAGFGTITIDCCGQMSESYFLKISEKADARAKKAAEKRLVKSWNRRILYEHNN